MLWNINSYLFLDAITSSRLAVVTKKSVFVGSETPNVARVSLGEYAILTLQMIFG